MTLSRAAPSGEVKLVASPPTCLRGERGLESASSQPWGASGAPQQPKGSHTAPPPRGARDRPSCVYPGQAGAYLGTCPPHRPL